jgi:hypothetical protein
MVGYRTVDDPLEIAVHHSCRVGALLLAIVGTLINYGATRVHTDSDAA